VKQFGEPMTKAIARLMRRWEVNARSGAAVELRSEMMRLAMSIIGITMFSEDVEEEAREIGESVTYALDFASRRTITLFDMPMWMPTEDNRRFQRAIGTLDKYVYGLIDARRKARGPDDLLTMLLEAHDPETGEGMSLKQVRDEVMTVFLAGHETTALALTWTWYLLSQHPAVEERLWKEVDSALEGRVPTVEDIVRMPYLQAVVNESMRVYPPVWVLARQAVETDVIGGYEVPAGALIVVSAYLTQRHPEVWEDGEQFDPERFMPGQGGAPGGLSRAQQEAYFPFGAGPRLCMGIHFALQEMQLAVAMIASRFRLRHVSDAPVVPTSIGTLRPMREMHMRVEERQR
jgi:cytochrome P450